MNNTSGQTHKIRRNKDIKLTQNQVAALILIFNGKPLLSLSIHGWELMANGLAKKEYLDDYWSITDKGRSFLDDIK